MTCTGVGIADGLAGERRDDIRRLLVERRRELLNEIQNRVRDIREEGSAKYHYSNHPAEAVEAEPDDDLAFALIQMKAEVLERVNEAVRHFDEGTHGYCVDCGEVIASSRLRAMPFAVALPGLRRYARGRGAPRARPIAATAVRARLAIDRLGCRSRLG